MLIVFSAARCRSSLYPLEGRQKLTEWRGGRRPCWEPREVDDLAETTGTEWSFLGAVGLGGITSLPEAATVTAAAAFGGGSFALGNILGSVSANLAILAVADVAVFPKPLLDEIDRRMCDGKPPCSWFSSP